MNVIAWAQHHYRSLLFLAIALIAGGVGSGLSLPVALLPRVNFPRVQVNLDAGDRPAERMVTEVTYPVEEALRSIPGVRSVRSTTSRGSAEVAVNFDWGQDMTSAKLQVESQINRVLTGLPPGTVFDVRRMDPTVFPVMAYSLTSQSQTQAELYDLAQYQLRPRLSTVQGVAKIVVQGGQIQEFQVMVDPAKLRAFGMTVNDVSVALSASNVLQAVGRLEDHDKLYLLVSDTSFQTPQQMTETLLRSGPTGVVTLGDVASVIDATEPQYTRVTADGADAVLLLVFQQPGGNTVQVARDVRSLLGDKNSGIPSGVQLANWYDQSELIVQSASSVRDAVLIGVALAAIVLIVFLRNWTITLIAILVVPSVLAATVLLLSVLGMSFNIMTLGGMAAAVGLIIDDAIVMIEHLARRLRAEQEHADDDVRADVNQRISTAAMEFTRPMLGSSLSTIIIFLPLAFLSGVTGAFFKALSATMATSLVISFFVAYLILPILASKAFRLGESEGEGKFAGVVDRGYRGLMRLVLTVPVLASLTIAPIFIAGYFSYRNVGSGFMPVMDEGGFIIDYVAPPGTSLPETDRRLRQVEQILLATPEVDTYSRRTGLQLDGGLSEANNGDFFVRLKPMPRRPIDIVMSEVRDKIDQTVPGLTIETAQLMEDLIGDLTAVPQPIEIQLYADHEQMLEQTAKMVAVELAKINGVVEVKNGIVLAGDALQIEVDRTKAQLEGMDPGEITRQVSNDMLGVVTTKIQRGPKLIGVRVWMPPSARQKTSDLSNLILRAPDGHEFPLNRVATVQSLIGQPEITRENLKRMIAVTGRISGRDLGSTVQDVQAKLDSAKFLPDGVTYQLGGLYKQQQIAFHGLMIVIIASVSLVFLLLLYLYESLMIACVMLTTTLLAVTAVFGGLWLTGTELNISAIMGMTMVVGIVTEVSIFFISEYQTLPRELPRRDRLISAGANRFRAIAMTTLAAILALLPLALAIGEGSAMQQPLAIAIVSGLVVQLPLVLVLMPACLAALRID